MIRIHFTAEDLARTRFLPEPAPLMELKLALVALHRRDAAPLFSRWRRAALTRFPESARPLWELVAGFSGAVSTTAVCGDLDEALDTVRGLSRDQGRQEASRWFGARGFGTMQLELLVPRAWIHPSKKFLHDWYTRLGYRVVRTGNIDEQYPALAPRLATPCDFVIYHKKLADPAPLAREAGRCEEGAWHE